MSSLFLPGENKRISKVCDGQRQPIKPNATSVKINVLQIPGAYNIMTFKKHMFHKWKNELKKLLVKLLRSWTVLLYTNITQGLTAEPGGRADRASMISFSSIPAPKLVAMRNSYCRT